MQTDRSSRVMGVAGLALAAVVTVSAPGVASAQDTFRPVTLDEAINIALRRNPTLEQSRLNIENAETTRLSAYGAFLPSVNLSYGYSNSSSGRLDPTNQGIVTTSYSAQLRGSYSLFDGWQRFSNLKSARLGVEEQRARYRQSEFETVRLVKQAYFDAVAARELVAVEERRVERQEDQLEFVQQQLDLGRATRSDLLRSQVDLNTARLALINAENNERTTTFRLTEVAGSNQRIGPVEEATLSTAPLPFTRQQVLNAGEVGSPAIVTANAATEAAQAAVSGSRSAYLPDLSFSGGWAWSNQEFPPTNRSWSLSLSGSYPLFNGFQRETQVYRAQAQADIAAQQERATRLNIRSEIDAAFSTAQAAQTGIDLATQSVELSEESLRVVQERYRLGLATILDLQAAQITLSESEVELVQRRFDYQLALAQLEALLGQGLEDETSLR